MVDNMLAAQIIIGGKTIIKYLLIATPTKLGETDIITLIRMINKPESHILFQELNKESKANKFIG